MEDGYRVTIQQLGGAPEKHDKLTEEDVYGLVSRAHHDTRRAMRKAFAGSTSRVVFTYDMDCGIEVEAPGEFQPLVMTDLPGQSEQGLSGQLMRDWAARVVQQADLVLHVIDAAADGLENFFRQLDEGHCPGGYPISLVFNKLNDWDAQREAQATVDKKAKRGALDKLGVCNIYFTDGQTCLAHKLMETRSLSLEVSQEDAQKIAGKESLSVFDCDTGLSFEGKMQYLVWMALGKKSEDMPEEWKDDGSDTKRKKLNRNMLKEYYDHEQLLGSIHDAAARSWETYPMRLVVASLEDKKKQMEQAQREFDLLESAQQAGHQRVDEVRKLRDWLKGHEDISSTYNVHALCECSSRWKQWQDCLGQGIKNIQDGRTDGLALLGWSHACIATVLINTTFSSSPSSNWPGVIAAAICRMVLSDQGLNDDVQQAVFRRWVEQCGIKRPMPPFLLNQRDLGLFSAPVALDRSYQSSVANVLKPVHFLTQRCLSSIGSMPAAIGHLCSVQLQHHLDMVHLIKTCWGTAGLSIAKLEELIKANLELRFNAPLDVTPDPEVLLTGTLFGIWTTPFVESFPKPLSLRVVQNATEWLQSASESQQAQARRIEECRFKKDQLDLQVTALENFLQYVD